MGGIRISFTSEVDDPSERRADDDADGEIDGVTLDREFLKFFPHVAI